ncbi:hypothetical protein ETAA8_45390 [Anatilimnocola aggregata]|uniref:Uncharacterized protein n=1 Tax=Anatilimnocola aggregata TaxID=2528021 RepID=A0A517YGT9_9BACT|nr:hypothetical protein [Anatilimnocola aggregata]QDU29429.1 hypothetical protein ETAA8_45390 [Anatilimnocola aggregata]
MLSKNDPEKKTTKSSKKASPKSTTAAAETSSLDVREQLFNEGLIGPVRAVQVSAARITQVRGLMFDVDPGLLKPDGAMGEIPATPVNFYERVIRPILDRSPVLAKAEVRSSGTGLHVILGFDAPYQCDSDAAREDIARVADVVLCLLPSDPMQPGITAVTRPIGSLNSKNGATVELITPGEPVTYTEVRDLAVRFVASPFRMLCEVLFGGERIRPCPVCREAETTLVVQEHYGNCYGCGKVTLPQIWNSLYRVSKEVNDGQEE